MHWNEKINLIKSRYDSLKFRVPQRNRKRILRQIETNFIKRPLNYYKLNNYNSKFSNWWVNLQIDKEYFIDKNNFEKNLQFFDKDKNFWIACDFETHTFIYDTQFEPAI